MTQVNVLEELVGHVLSAIVDVLVQEWGRFCACLLLALAISALILVLAPARTLSIILSISVTASGLVGGVWWERTSR